MKTYICSDIHNQFEKFIPPKDIDLFICAGDMTNLGEYSEKKNIRRWFELLPTMLSHTLYIPGNHDLSWKSSDFGKYATNLLDRPYAQWINGVYFCGASLAPCYDAPQLAIRWDNMTANRQAEKAYYEAIPSCDVLISHSPPSGPTGTCRDHMLDFGSQELRQWIEKHQPKLVICGHIHKPLAREEIIGNTRVINTATIGQVIEIYKP